MRQDGACIGRGKRGGCFAEGKGSRGCWPGAVVDGVFSGGGAGIPTRYRGCGPSRCVIAEFVA